MSTIEALIITMLGMSVVFVGLVLCIVFIHLSQRAARRIPWTDHGHAGEATATAAPPAPALAAAAAPPGEPPSPQVLAVIAAVLEMEQRLYQGRSTSRLTIRRSGAGA